MTERLVHVCNGDATADSLGLADLPGDIRVYADALDQGPLLPVGDDAFRAARAAFWAGRVGGTVDAHAAKLAAYDRALDDLAGVEEVVLWFEHDLFDQLALARILARLARRGLPPQLTIVSIDRHPEVPTFLGLGQLAPEQLAQLWPQRAPLSRDALDEAIATWIAVTAADPRALPFLARRVKALPFLGGAIERHLEEFPDPSSGLARSERQILAACARGEASIAALVQQAAAGDPRYPLTDVLARHVLATFAAQGLVERADAPTITAAGRAVLAGATDRARELGLATWRGGVEFAGTGACWRWASGERRLVEK